MIFRAMRIPGAVRRSLHRGTTDIIVPSFTDDFSALTPYVPSSVIVNTAALYDGDIGIATGIGSGGGTSWDTSNFNDWTAWDTTSGPLSRFVGAT